MKKYLIIFICLLQAVCGFSQKTSAWSLFNDGWEFAREDDPWEKITLPHTARLEPLVITGDQWQGICHYRKLFHVPVADRDKRISVYFEAAMQEAFVYLNGELLVTHTGGYLPFEVDITGKFYPGEENVLLIKLDNRDNPLIPPGKPIRSLDFCYYSGIYRNAWLVVQDKLRFPDAVASNRRTGGAVVINFENVSREKASANFKTEIENGYGWPKKAQIRWIVSDATGKVIRQDISPVKEVAANSFEVFENKTDITEPNLWSPENPYLYTIRVELITGGKVIENLNMASGIRSISFITGGFYLNGSKYRIRGTNRHQEYPYVGNAVPDAAQFRDAWKIKEAGFNFVRCSHYPQSTAFLDACDELGILVMNSIPGWQFFGEEEFQEHSYRDTRDMVRRDRNHPCVVLWEASLNESGMPKSFMENAHRIVREELPFKDVFTCGWMEGIYDVFVPARQHAKPPFYWNRYTGTQPLLIAEYGDWEYYAQNAGFNQTAFSNLKETERSSRQLRGDGEVRLLQQALNYQESHNDNYKGVVVGDANWLMFDYNRGYAPDIESSGISDIFRLPKFAFRFYQSQYGPVADAKGFGQPMVFIANDHTPASPLLVKVFSNCEEVELLVNGKRLALQKPDTDQNSSHLPHPPFTFSLPEFEAGTLQAVGYIKGVRAAGHSVNTPGKAVAISLRTDLSGREITAGNPDLVFIYASLTDSAGTVVARDALPVSFTVKGAAELVGTNPIVSEAGIATILLKTGGAKGAITITAEAPGLGSASLLIKPKSPRTK